MNELPHSPPPGSLTYYVPTIPVFVEMCDAFCKETGRSRVWLSKKIFNDTNRIEVLATRQDTDMGVRRLEAAVGELRGLEAQARKEAKAAAKAARKAGQS